MTKVAIVGATGPTGIHLATELCKADTAVRVIARGMDKLARLFPRAAVEKQPADILDADATLRAVEGCDLVYDCIGLPGDQMHLHPAVARNIAAALRLTNARCVQVSSYWAYYPQVRTEMNERHTRGGGPAWVRYRREAEDILCEAGAAILHLPDFYGPQVHASTLQNALNEAASGKAIHWVGKGDVPREYVYVPDAMRIAATIGRRAEAFGAHWCLPGSGPLSAQQAADIAGRHLGWPIKVRSVGMMTLRVISIFTKDLRGFLQVAPDYMKPVRYDAGKLQGLLGPPQMTSYDAGIGQTLAWIAATQYPKPESDNPKRRHA
jgi:nucleoside-diphosphate-sugar epimerase